jgi:hypothetical protein
MVIKYKDLDWKLKIGIIGGFIYATLFTLTMILLLIVSIGVI